jgi:ribosomal-protein-serine acetyltransferase
MLTNGTIVLRPPMQGDADAIASAVQASLRDLSRWLPWATPTYNPSDALDWISNRFDATAHSFLILDAAGNVVGTCGLNQIERASLRANLGYWLHSDFTGRGYATMATKLVANHGLSDLGLQRLEIVMSVENEPSRKVAERSGAWHEGIQKKRLQVEGVTHDAHMFSITEPQLD